MTKCLGSSIFEQRDIFEFTLLFCICFVLFCSSVWIVSYGDVLYMGYYLYGVAFVWFGGVDGLGNMIIIIGNYDGSYLEDTVYKGVNDESFRRYLYTRQ